MRERRDPIVPPVQHDVERVIDRAPGHFAALIGAALFTGALQDELVQAKRSKINHEHKTLTVVGKRNRLRTIDLKPFDAYDLFAKLPAGLKTDFIFWHDDGKPYANVASRFRLFVKEARTSIPTTLGRLDFTT